MLLVAVHIIAVSYTHLRKSPVSTEKMENISKKELSGLKKKQRRWKRQHSDVYKRQGVYTGISTWNELTGEARTAGIRPVIHLNLKLSLIHI